LNAAVSALQAAIDGLKATEPEPDEDITPGNGDETPGNEDNENELPNTATNLYNYLLLGLTLLLAGAITLVINRRKMNR